MATFTPTMNDAIECNNIGVSLLKAELFTDALFAFQVAAQLMYPVSQVFERQSPSSPPASPGPVQVPKAAPAPTDPTSFDMLDMVKLRLILLDEIGHSECLTTNCFASAEPFTANLVFGTPSSCTVESIIIVYNTGLTFLLISQMDKALCMFDTSFRLASTRKKDRNAVKVTMASLNNAGLVHHSQGNYTLSRNYLDALSAYILSLPVTTSPGLLRQQHAFLLNALLLQKPTVAGAA
jgi:hypothetical protein